MLVTITDGREIAICQKKFTEVLTEGAQSTEIDMGIQSESWTAEVFWHEEQGFWYSWGVKDTRYWNLFGVSNPMKVNYGHSITCQINFPIKGLNKRIAGAFVRSSDGEVSVIHRGGIGGGRQRVGKSTFFEHHKGPLVHIDDPSSDFAEVALIGDLDDAAFLDRVGEFIQAVDEIKRNATA